MENKITSSKTNTSFSKWTPSWFLRQVIKHSKNTSHQKHPIFKATGGQNLQWPEDA